MIVYWMLYSLVVGVLLSGCAAALEMALRSLGRATRWTWAAALLLTLAGPVAVRELSAPPALPTPLPGALPAGLEPAGAEMEPRTPAPVPGAAVPNDPPSRRDEFDHDALQQPLAMVWMLSSAAAVAVLAAMAGALGRRRRAWTAAEVDGVPVLVSNDAGPALVGLLRPRIVLPRWVLGAHADARTLMLEHEQEHVRAGDARLLAAALAAVVLMPWNPAVWWQLRRLRLAVEVDCDARVLRRRADVRAYGSLLLEVSRRASRPAPAAALAFVEPVSTLERRIRIMTAPRVRRPLLRAAAFGAVAATLTAAAWQAPAPVPPPAAPLDTPAGIAARAARSRVGPRDLLERYDPRVLRDGMRDDEMVVFVLSYGGEVLHHKRVRPASDAALSRELLPYVGQIGAYQGYLGAPRETGLARGRVDVVVLRPTAAEVANLADLSGRTERRSYLRAVRRHYPEALRRAGVTGQVTVRIRAEPRKKPRVLEVVRGDPRFFAAARAVVGDLYVSGRGENLMVITFPATRAVPVHRTSY